MTDDPTTKPCPIHEGVSGGNPKCWCGGTGRVPLTTDELLEALWERIGDRWSLFPTGVFDTGTKYTVELFSGEHVPIDDMVGGETPADALRAALRAVSDGS